MSFDEESFDFSNHSGLNLISGVNNDVIGSKNGAGKSNLINALLFGLFGKTLNGVNRDRIPNRFCSADRHTIVTLNFLVDDIPYRITSGLRPKTHTSYCQLERLDLPEDEQKLTKSSIRDTRRFIEDEIIHCRFEIFLRSIVLTSDQSYNFFKLNKNEKRDFIEQVFDLVVFGEMYNIIHKDVLILDKDMAIIDREYSTIDNQLVQLNTQHTGHIKSKKDEMVDLLTDIKELKYQFDTLKSNIPTSLDDIDDKHDRVIAKRKVMNDDLDKYRKTETKISNAMEKLEYMVVEKKKYIDKYVELFTKLCDDCSPIFDTTFELSKVSSEISDIEDVKLVKLSEKYENVTKKLEKYDEAFVKLNVMESKIIGLKNDKQKYDKYINQMNSTRDEIKRSAIVIRELQTYIDGGTSPFIDMVESTTCDFEIVKKKLKSVDIKLKYLKFIENIVSDDNIRKVIVSDLVKLLNQHISQYLNRMGAKFNCVFDDNLFYSFHTESGEADYNNFSSGEKMRLSIATSLAFRDFMANRSGVNCNILVLDEYIDSNIDALAIRELINILKEFNINHKQDIYIVSHRSELSEDLFTRMITIEKTDGISKVVVEEDNTEE